MINHLRPLLGDLEISEQALALLDAHWHLVKQWNARTNLTRIVDDASAALLHYRDSLELLPHLAGSDGPIADIGTGAGFPGIPLAICMPDARFTLVEPRRKKVSFLRTVKAQLALGNVEVYEGKSTDAPPQLFANVVSRATFSDLSDLRACLRWLKPGGRLLAMRAADGNNSCDEQIPYQLGEQQRVLDIWDAL